MRVLICGSRYWKNTDLIWDCIEMLHNKFGNDLVIIEGEARGADSIARDVAHDLKIKVERYPANWNKFGRAAGPIRNRQMMKEGKPDLVLAFHNNIHESKGTKDMVNVAIENNVKHRILTNKG